LKDSNGSQADLFDNFDPSDPSTIYTPINFPSTFDFTVTVFGTPVTATVTPPNPAVALNDTRVAFDVSKDEFKVAAGYSFGASDTDTLLGLLNTALDGTPIDIPDNIISELQALNDRYDIFASLEVEGKAKAGSNPSYARNFIVDDEAEIYLGLVHDNGTPLDHSDDTTIAELGIEVELTKKKEETISTSSLTEAETSTASLAHCNR
jgi:hypothetical protein